MTQKVAETTKTLSVAIPNQPLQGFGWREFGGDGWIQPEAKVGTFYAQTDDDQPVLCFVDPRTGLSYILATRDGPDGSGISKEYVDKKSSYGGFEIPWAVKFKQHTAIEEHELIKHVLTYLNFRPQSNERKGAAGHDAGGYRDAQSISLIVWKNGNVINASITSKIPPKGAVTFDEKIQANQVQLQIQGTASELRITEARTSYEELGQRVSPDLRLMPYHDYQQEYASPFIWLSRSKTPLMNRGVGSVVDGSIFGLTTGPDNVENSAMVFSNISTISQDLTTVLTGDFSASFWVASIISTVEVFRYGTLIVSINVVAGVYFLQIGDNGTNYVQSLSWDGTNWLSVKIDRVEDRWVVSENGIQIITFYAFSTTSFTGTFECVAGNPKRLFDIRIFDQAISADAAAYYYGNIIEDNGSAILPIIGG